MVQAYFEDLNGILKHLRVMAEPRAQVWFVVATSDYAGVEVKVDEIFAEVGKRVGWKHKQIKILRNLRSSGQQWNRISGKTEMSPKLRESLVIFERN